MKLLSGFFCVFLYFFVIVNGYAESLDKVRRPFQVYDGTLYSHKPDFMKYGIKPINILYESRFWTKGEDKQKLPDQKKVRRLANQAALKNEILVVDIESWWIHGEDKDVQKSVDKYVNVLRWIHDEEPTVTVGMFGVVPIEDHGRSSLSFFHPKFLRWKKENERLLDIANEADVIFPSIYTFYEDKDKWKRAAISIMKQAKSYGKPVYVFLWPYYSEKSKANPLRPLSDDYWKMQLETVREYADGVVIWGGWNSKIWGPAKWNNDFNWWQVTKEFIESNRVNSSLK